MFYYRIQLKKYGVPLFKFFYNPVYPQSLVFFCRKLQDCKNIMIIIYKNINLFYEFMVFI